MKRRTIISSIVIGVVVLLLNILYNPISLNKVSNVDYSTVLKEANISDDVKVIDIALLGAHDAFSDKINLTSTPDPGEDGIVAKKIVNAAFKGGLVRLSKAQKSNASQLLKKGVRYFDVRISYTEDGWYTKHALLSAPLRNYLEDIYRFLSENNS